MSDWHPQVVRIEKIEKHPDADRLIIVTVLGNYPVITNITSLCVGDLIGYLPIDTIVPDTEAFYFLCPQAYEQYEEDGIIKNKKIGPKYTIGSVPEKYRILKAKKIRGIYSMGMLHPVENMDEGSSLVDILGLKKWEEEVDDDVEFNGVKVKTRGANQESPPKDWTIPYYDIESLRKYSNLVEGEGDIILTEKINGSNAAYCYDGKKLWCKSRNYFKKFDPEDMWVDLAIRNNLEEKLSKFPMKVFFGECCGQVKKYRYDAVIEDGKLKTKIYFFDIYDIVTGKYVDYDEFKTILDQLNLPSTPVLYRGPWLGKDKMFPFAEGNSILNPSTIREGFVLRLGKEKFEPKLNGRLQLKLVGEGYTLSK